MFHVKHLPPVFSFLFSSAAILRDLYLDGPVQGRSVKEKHDNKLQPHGSQKDSSQCSVNGRHLPESGNKVTEALGKNCPHKAGKNTSWNLVFDVSLSGR